MDNLPLLKDIHIPEPVTRFPLGYGMIILLVLLFLLVLFLPYIRKLYLKSKKRSASIAFPRQIAMYLSRTILNESFERIGLEFGGKDHTTVMHSCEKIKNEIDNKEETRKTVEDIKQNIP